MCILMGKRLAVFLNFKVFWDKNAKIDFFKREWFESSFYKIDV